jgi:hypothetical protein
MDNAFQSLQSEALIVAVITAIFNTAFAIFGTVVVVHPRWLREDHGTILGLYAVLQMVLALIMIGMGGYLADHVHGFQSSFRKFGANDSIPYYNIMYWGGVAQAAYGAVLTIILALTFTFLDFVSERYETKHWVQTAVRRAAAPNDSEKEGSQV